MLYLPLNVMEVIGKFLQYNTKAPVIPVSQKIDPKTTVSFFCQIVILFLVTVRSNTMNIKPAYGYWCTAASTPQYQ